MKGLLLLTFVFGLCAAAAYETQWELQGDASDEQVVGMYLSLKHRNLEAFQAIFDKITDPNSKQYAQWFESRDSVLDMIAPPADKSAAVEQWVRTTCSAGELRVCENRRDTVKVRATVACMKKLFPTAKFASFKHKERRATVVRLHAASPKPQVPAHVADVVDMVVGLDMLPVVRKKKTQTQAMPEYPNADTYDYVWLGTSNRVYNIQSNNVSQATQSVIEFSPEGAPFWQDLKQYDQWSQIPFNNFSYIVGPFDTGNNGESLLDIQLISSVAQTPTAYITIEDGWIYGMANELFSMNNAPQVNSVSYGWPEMNSCQVDNGESCNDAQAYVEKSELEMQKATALGLTIIVCSQDEGAPSEANLDCSLDETHPVWSIYPGSSQFATSVSATTLVTTGGSRRPADGNQAPICQQGYACSTGSVEIPCAVNNTYYQWTTGGGFSTWLPQPAWQKNVVEQYLQKQVPFPPQGKFNTSNRAYPDISAFGSRILVVSGGQISISAGTSAATPIIAGIATLINDALLQAGKKPIGFMTPALYKIAAECPECFNKITSGDNRSTEGQTCKYGYYVPSDGSFNTVTGLGTPNVQMLIQKFLALQQ